MSFFSRLFNSQGRAAERDLERRIAAFRAEVLAERATADADRLARLKERPAAMGLSEDDVALELEMVDGLIEVVHLRAGSCAGRPLPLVESNHHALRGESCHFAAPAFRPDIAGDTGGKLFFTSCRLVYLGPCATSLSWAHVIDVREAERDLVVRARPAIVRAFRCNSYVDTLRGAFIVSRLLSR